MQIRFNTAHLKLNDRDISKATAFAERKLIALKKYLKKEEGLTHVYVELGKASEAHNNGNIWTANINLDTSKGQRFNARAVGERLESAIDKAATELDHELRKAKVRQASMLKKGGGILKSIARGFKPS